MAAAAMVPGGGSSNDVTPLPYDSADGGAVGRPRRRRRLRVRADRELDRGLGAADAGQPRRGHAAADLRRAHPRRRVQHRRAAGHRRRRRADRRRVPGRRARRCGGGWPRNLPDARARARQLQRRRGQRRRRGPRRRGREHRAGRAAATAWPRWPPASSTNRTPGPGSCSSARPGPPPARTGADRTSVVLRLDNVPGALVAAMTEFADPRHRPDPHRIPAHPKSNWAPTSSSSTASGTSTTIRWPRHSRRCTDVVQTCDIWVHGRRAPPSARHRRHRRGVALAGGTREGAR